MTQDGFNHQGSLAKPPAKALLDADEAAAFLGVKLATLYAYASRGWLESVPGERGKKKSYRRDELLKLKARSDARRGHGPVAAAALRFGEPVLESSITRIGPLGPEYRGQAAVTLAERGARFEQAAEILFGGVPGPWAAPSLAPLEPFIALLPARSSLLPILSFSLQALAVNDADRMAAPDAAEHTRARSLVRALIGGLALVAGRRRAARALAAESVAESLLLALNGKPAPRALAAVDRALVLSADHELNPSSFAARVAASTGADLYACLAAALAAHSGPRHGSASERVLALVDQIEKPGAAAAVIRERARRGEEITGFEQPLYPKGDPRAPPLLEAARDLGPRSRRLETLFALVRAMSESGRGYPTVDVGLLAVTLALGLPDQAAGVLFAIGRSAGWVAHALEQRKMGGVLRPRARYVPQATG